MSDYDERPRRRHGGSTRTREPEYIETEETYIKKGRGNQDLVLRTRERDDDYDDDDRGYPAEIRRKSYREDYGPPRRTRSSGYNDRDYYDDDYSDEPRSRRHRQSRYDDDAYSDDDRYSRKDRRKSGVEGILESVGLGGVAATVIKKARSMSRGPRGRGDRDRGRRDSSSDRSHYGSRNRSKSARRKWQQAAKAAVVTGVIEAVRSRNEPGGWAGAKGQRVATAALGAAGIDGFLDKDPDRKSKRHIVESVVGGLAVNRLANGGRDADDSRGRSQSRSRSQSVMGRLRSRSRSVFGRGRSSSRGAGDRGGGNGLKELAAVGGVAAVGKAIYDKVRSKSRGRTRRDASISSDDSYVPSRRQRYRERGEPEQIENQDRGRSTEAATGGANRGARGSSSSSVSTTDLEHQHKKTRGKELLTAGLATVATIHAAHGVYSSMVASEKRHKLEAEGKITPEEARKRKSKNMLQDAAAVGIAALGIKSAFSEWKDVNESRHEKHELEARKRRKAKARQRRMQEMRQGHSNNYGPGANYYQGAPQYGDANPYQAYAGNLPPPPVGAPSNRYPS